MEITACPICGSTNIGIGTLGDGIISGLSSWNEVCKDCGYQGTSLVFGSESEYKKFLEALSYQTIKSETQYKEVIEENSGPDLDKNISIQLKKTSYLFEFIVSSVLTILFFIILSGSGYFGVYSDYFSQKSLGSIILFLLGSFLGLLLFFFLLIVFIETIYRSIHIEKK